MAVLLVVEEDGDGVTVRKIPRPGQESQEPVKLVGNAPGCYVSGARFEANEAARMLSIHLLLAPRLIVPAGAEPTI